jgi:hypothetical protein
MGAKTAIPTLPLTTNASLIYFLSLLPTVVCLVIIGSLKGDLWNLLKINIIWVTLFIELSQTRYNFISITYSYMIA